MLPAGPLFHKPKSILAARNLLYASLFLAIIGFLVVQFVLNVSVNPDMKLMISTGLLIILLYVAIRYIGFGKKWARTMFLVIFILNVISFFMTAPFIFKANLALGFLFVIQMLLQILALIYLYSKSANAWFNSFELADTVKPKVGS